MSSFQQLGENEIYCNYYSYCVHIGNKQKICYIEPDLSLSKNISRINLIVPDSISTIKNQPENTILPILSYDSGSLQKFMESLYYDEPLENNIYVLPKMIHLIMFMG